MRAFMYVTAFFVLAIGVMAAVFGHYGMMPLPEEYLQMAGGIAKSVLYALVFVGMAGLYGRRNASGETAGKAGDRHSRRTKHAFPGAATRVNTPSSAETQASQDDDTFLVVPDDEPS